MLKLFPDGYSFVTSSEARVSVARVARRSVNLFSNGHNFATSCSAYAVSPILILIISACKVLSMRSVPISRFVFFVHFVAIVTIPLVIFFRRVFFSLSGFFSSFYDGRRLSGRT